MHRSRDIAIKSSNESTPRQIDYSNPSKNQHVATPTIKHYMSCDGDREEEAAKNNNSSLNDLGIISAFSTFPGANTPPSNSSDSLDNDLTPWLPFTQSATSSLYNSRGAGSHCTRPDGSVTQCPRDGDFVTPTRRRANSSLSTVSMSNVPEYLSASQLLSPRGLAATSSLFESTKSDESAKVYALRGEDVVTGLGIASVNIFSHLVECGDVYEFCHSEEGGGVPIRKGRKGGKKWRRDENDIDGDFVAIDHYHLEEDDCSSGDEDSDGIAQGGVSLDVPTPFPKFDEVTAAILEATGGVTYTMPIGPTRSGTMEYVLSRRCRR